MQRPQNVHPFSQFFFYSYTHSLSPAVGKALALQDRPLVYGGGSAGIMGVVSGAVLEHGGKVTGIVPYAMVISGGERDKGDPEKRRKTGATEKGREAVSDFFQWILWVLDLCIRRSLKQLVA